MTLSSEPIELPLTLFDLAAQPSKREQIQAYLSEQDPDMAHLIAHIGPVTIELLRDRDLYLALLETIAHQQLHARAAQSILRKLRELSEGVLPSAEQLLSLSEESLRQCGFSHKKIQTLYAVARAKLENIVPTPEECLHLSNEDIRERLIHLPGIGRWSTDMLLIFSLGRIDVFPAEDFGIREGWRLLKKEERQLSLKQMAYRGGIFAPYRSVAAWYLWRRADQNKKNKTPSTLTGAVKEETSSPS